MGDWIWLRVALSRAGRRLKAKGVKKAKCSFGAIYWQNWPKVSGSSVYLFIAATRGDCFIPPCLRSALPLPESSSLNQHCVL